MQNRRVIALPWITRTEWRTWKSLDPVTLPGSYQEWLDIAQKQVYEVMLSGIAFELVAIHAAQCGSWCKAREIVPDAAGRQAYANSRLDDGKSGRRRQTAEQHSGLH